MDRRELLRIAALVLGSSISSACTRALLSADRDWPLDSAVLDAPQRTKVALLAELIIPQTDTPGAIEAGVPEFIHRIVADWYSRDERAVFLSGLESVDRQCSARFGADFASASLEQRVAVLQTFETRPWGTDERAFFAQLKELTVLGYYTSELGSRYELVYRPVPGAYHGNALFHATDRPSAL